MYIKAKSMTFPTPVPPYQDIQLCNVMPALQNDSEMRYVKSLFDTFKDDCKISTECSWLKGNDGNSDDDLDDVYMEMQPEDHTMYQIPVAKMYIVNTCITSAGLPSRLHCFM